MAQATNSNKRPQVLIKPESRKLLGEMAEAEGRTLIGQLALIIRDAAKARGISVEQSTARPRTAN